jgi:hypothetical protein
MCDCVSVSYPCRNKQVLFPCNDSKVFDFDIEMHCVLDAVGTEVLIDTSVNFRVKLEQRLLLSFW